MDELQLLQHQISLQQRGNGAGVNNPTVFSDLASFNASMSRKRPPPPVAAAAAAALPDSSVITSTSGVAPPSHNLVALLRQKDLEIDAVVRLHTERLRNEVREVTKRHCRGILSAAEREAARRLREKVAELEVARLTNAALEEKVRQLIAENQMRLAAAKHHEAAVGVLRGSLQRALLLQQRSIAGASGREGYGDSEVISAAESSCCLEAEEKGLGLQQRRRRRLNRWWCKACGRHEARTLLLPCKHLCLCEECEPAVGQCPVCGAAKTAGFQVFTC